MFSPFVRLFDRLILFLRWAHIPLNTYFLIRELKAKVHDLTVQQAVLIASLEEMSALASSSYTPRRRSPFRDPPEEEIVADHAIFSRSYAAIARAQGKRWKYFLTKDGLEP